MCWGADFGKFAAADERVGRAGSNEHILRQNMRCTAVGSFCESSEHILQADSTEHILRQNTRCTAVDEREDIRIDTRVGGAESSDHILRQNTRCTAIDARAAPAATVNATPSSRDREREKGDKGGGREASDSAEAVAPKVSRGGEGGGGGGGGGGSGGDGGGGGGGVRKVTGDGEAQGLAQLEEQNRILHELGTCMYLYVFAHTCTHTYI